LAPVLRNRSETSGIPYRLVSQLRPLVGISAARHGIVESIAV
jgi:hypothetical protein